MVQIGHALPLLDRGQLTEIYVAPDGDDENTGEIDAPFATLKAAVVYSRGVKINLAEDVPISIVLRQGTYRVDETIYLDERDDSLTIRAYEDETVVFSGSSAVPIEKIQYHDGIYQADLKQVGILDYGTVRKVGFGRPYGASWGEVFVNEKAFQLARYPNRGMLPIEEALAPGSIPREGDYANKGGTIRYTGKRLDSWVNESDPWIGGYFMWGYADDLIPVAGIDTIANSIHAAAATMYGMGDGMPYRTWYGFNLKSELDSVSEYYVDRENGVLYFMSDEQPQSVEFSMLESPFFDIVDTKGLTIRGITFENARGIGITTLNTDHLLIEGCVFQHLGSLGVSMGLGITPFQDLNEETGGIPARGIVGSLPQYLYSHTTFNRKSGQNNVIRDCVFRHLGSGGVSLGGGDRLTLEKGYNRVESCVFLDNNRIEKSYRPAIHLSGVGNVAAHCEIFETPGVAILLHGNDHLVEYNYIHDVATEVNDLGAIYYGRDPSERGLVVRYNVIADIPDVFLTAGIYHDDGACGLTAYSNVLINAGQRSVLMGGGSDNKYYNNLFIGSKAGVFIDDRLRTWAKSLILPDTGLYAIRLRAVDYTGAVYRRAYPTLADYFSTVPMPTHNVFNRNVFINFEEPVFAKGKSMEWRKLALGFSETNVIQKDENVWATLDSSGLPGVLMMFSSVLDPIPIERIGVEPSSYIRTRTNRWGIQEWEVAPN